MQCLCSEISHCKSREDHSGCFAFAFRLVFHSFVFYAHVLLSADGCRATKLTALTAAACWIYTTVGQRPLRYRSVNTRDICKLGLEKGLWTCNRSSISDKRWTYVITAFFPPAVVNLLCLVCIFLSEPKCLCCWRQTLFWRLYALLACFSCGNIWKLFPSFCETQGAKHPSASSPRLNQLLARKTRACTHTHTQ